jgi:hypothetical protein
MGKRKFMVEFSEELDEVIGTLAARQGVPKTQVIREAVSLLKYVDDQQQEGHRLAIADEDGRLMQNIVR